MAGQGVGFCSGRLRIRAEAADKEPGAETKLAAKLGQLRGVWEVKCKGELRRLR